MFVSTTTNRIEWLDAVKGIGIILVMMSHLCILPHQLIDGYIPLFFIATGITYKFRPFKADIKTKAKRLLFPYICYNIVILLYNGIYSFIKGKFCFNDLYISILGVLYSRSSLGFPYSPDDIRLLGIINAPMWFLVCMFVSCLYYMCFCRIKLKAIAVLCVIAAIYLLQHVQYQLPWSIDLAFMAVSFMLIGNVIGKHYPPPTFYKRSFLFRLLIFIISIAIYILLANINGRVNMSVRDYGDMGALSIPVFILVGCLYFYIVSRICINMENTIWSKILAYLGQHSLRLLCIHLLVVSAVSPVVNRFVEMMVSQHLLYVKNLIVISLYLLSIVVADYIAEKVLEKSNWSLAKYL